jgi:acetylornithine deacetylase
VDENAPIVRTIDTVVTPILGMEPIHTGMSGWTDAQVLDGAGIPSVLFGPGSEPDPSSGAMGPAHAAIEYVSIASTATCARILMEVARSFCGVTGG